jgi:peptide/nickel transport system ATP-binding protein
VIPPAEYEIEQGRFRELMDLRVDLRNGSLRLDIAQRRADTEDPDAVVEYLLEERFSGEFADAEVASVVEDALGQFAVGNTARATEVLAEAFTSPCERESPDLRQVEEGRLVACHLYE